MEQYAQPLAFNESLLLAAEIHTQDQFDNQFQGHTSSNNPPPFQPRDGLGDRLDALGYDGSAGESVYPGFPIWMYLKLLQAPNIAYCSNMYATLRLPRGNLLIFFPKPRPP